MLGEQAMLVCAKKYIEPSHKRNRTNVLTDAKSDSRNSNFMDFISSLYSCLGKS